MGIYVYTSGVWTQISSGTGMYEYKGTVETLNDLPESADIGDAYYVISESSNYAWNGETWGVVGNAGEGVTPLSNNDIDTLLS